MKTLPFKRGLRTGRIFSSGDHGDDDALRESARAAYFTDTDDRRRDVLIRRLLSQRIIVARALPAADAEHEVHIFLSVPDDRAIPELFACAIVSADRLRQLVSSVGGVAESFTLQVSPTLWLSESAIKKALWTWIKRNYPRLRQLPALRVEFWRAPLGQGDHARRRQPRRAMARVAAAVRSYSPPRSLVSKRRQAV